MNYRDLFELNLSKIRALKDRINPFLESMRWREIKEEDLQSGQDSEFIDRLSVDVYGDHLLVMKNESENGYDRLYCCNRRRPFFCLLLT